MYISILDDTRIKAEYCFTLIHRDKVFGRPKKNENGIISDDGMIL